MQQIVSLTSQGQISIPRKMLRHHKITKSGKVMIVPTKTGWAVEPVADFWSLRGSLKSDIVLTDAQLRKARAEFETKWARKM